MAYIKKLEVREYMKYMGQHKKIIVVNVTKNMIKIIYLQIQIRYRDVQKKNVME